MFLSEKKRLMIVWFWVYDNNLYSTSFPGNCFSFLPTLCSSLCLTIHQFHSKFLLSFYNILLFFSVSNDLIDVLELVSQQKLLCFCYLNFLIKNYHFLLSLPTFFYIIWMSKDNIYWEISSRYYIWNIFKTNHP